MGECVSNRAATTSVGEPRARDEEKRARIGCPEQSTLKSTTTEADNRESKATQHTEQQQQVNCRQQNKDISRETSDTTEYNKVIHVPVDDASYKSIYELIYMLDWLSIYIADFRKVDSLNVPNIMSLKEFLGTVN